MQPLPAFGLPTVLSTKRFMNYYTTVLKKYAVFSGRSRRSEYWYFLLFSFLVSFVLAIIDAVLGIGVLYPIYSLAVLVPSLAVLARRLHDINRSGWWMFISLIPLVGVIVLIVFLVKDSDPGENRFGPNPKGAIL